MMEEDCKVEAVAETAVLGDSGLNGLQFFPTTGLFGAYPPESFPAKLQELINSHSIENGSNTPDFILAEYLRGCLDNFDMCVRRREEWYGR